MPTCTRNGCKKEFSLEENKESVCNYHPGAPVFHEGLKSWSCCSDVNKPEMEFDAFMRIPGCASGLHTTEVIKQNNSAPSTTLGFSSLQNKETTNETETYSSNDQTVPSVVTQLATPRPSSTAPVENIVEEEEDDVNTPVEAGTSCRRKGCNKKFISNEESRYGDGEAAICVYHPKPPIFHEGSKGYLCCKRRVLEFDEFMKIEGCRTGTHVFVPKKQEGKEILTECRIDHYQTRTDVHVSVFAKKVDQATSTIKFEENKVHLDLNLRDSKRFRRSLNLFGPIDPDQSKYTFFGTKVELTLRKSDGRSWNLLEQSTHDLGSYHLTFGVSGRTGTVGSREAILDDDNSRRS